MDKLKELRVARGWNMREVAAKLGMKYTTYVGYEKGDRQPHSEQLIKIARLYGVTVDHILGRDMRPAVVYADVIEKYAALDEHSRKVVNAVIDLEAERGGVVVPIKETKIIPLFVAAAGQGEPVSQEGFDDFEVEIDSPAKFAVKISGDSMEPELHDGEIVLCKRKRPEIGEIAVIMVNGFLLVKQYIEDGFGNMYLRSINRARGDLDVDIWATGNDTVVGYGTVIHRKIPLIKQ